MIAAPDRLGALHLIDDAVAAGARQHLACELLGLSERTVQRWRHTPKDKRPDTIHPEPANKLSEEERAVLLTT
ncbi:helix-turn-helix domain-containing protein, partial [Undibacterium sp. Ji50W]|uniref:helix-turn-helix domain-containing protein n=1 Tax=Undibacterium sp. Ji50W TaxID=3413041 RepID=UPI003BF1AC53